ncbi:Micronemal protein 15, related [Eimeria praecox]|uniref:Micronemal protein 15, related n=1 Tax=Eimeria praecox TaxID=51316 RepID=U6GNV2_9EIME|nr:Micronemal protein 15, related [Eimeria praecox]
MALQRIFLLVAGLSYLLLVALAEVRAALVDADRALAEVRAALVDADRVRSAADRENGDGYQEFTLDQLRSNAAFGGEALCKEKELEIVDFISGHPSAFLGGDGNCLLYSQAEEAAVSCQKDKELNDRIYCVLGIDDIPQKPVLSDLCDSPPSNEYHFGLFYDCVPSNSVPPCELESTTSWDSVTSSCNCPTGTFPCSVEEAKSSDAWMDEVGATAEVYVADSIRYLTPENVYEAFHLFEVPCGDSFARSLCRRSGQRTTTTTTTTLKPFLGDAGPDCFMGNDQPFCRLPCLSIWRQYYTSHEARDSYDSFARYWKAYDFSEVALVDAASIARVQACTFGQFLYQV